MTTKASGGVTSIGQKNYIINSTFIVNARGYVDGTPTSANLFCYDRWRAGLEPTNMSVSGHTATIDGRINQKIESLGEVGEMTLSWEGTALARVIDGTIADTGWLPSPITFTTNGDDIRALFNETGIETMLKPKLELGSVVTPFEYPDLATEVTKCQRFYQNAFQTQFSSLGTMRGGSGDTSTGETRLFVTQMRSTPTMTGSIANGVLVALTDPSGADVNPTNVGVQALDGRGWRYNTATATVVNGGSYQLFTGSTGFSWTADADAGF